jgi:serine protein kinase
MAAMFAVFTRMRKPNPDRYAPRVGAAVSGSRRSRRPTSTRRASARAPRRRRAEAPRANIKELWTESDAYPIYEGRIGASPREMRVVLLDAAQSPSYKCLSRSPSRRDRGALPEQGRVRVAAAGRSSGGYHDVKEFARGALTTRLLDAWEYELYVASGFIDEEQYAELFDRYVQHVSVWVKKERISQPCHRRVRRARREDDASRSSACSTSRGRPTKRA